MKDVVYVHYGVTKDKFDPERVRKLRPRQPIAKPNRGIWASPDDNEKFYTWKTWATGEEFSECSEDNCFRFKIKDNARIILIDSPEAFKSYLDKHVLIIDNRFGRFSLDLYYPAGIYNEYDGIELVHGDHYAFFHSIWMRHDTEVDDNVKEQNAEMARFMAENCGIFNSWDCDSVCIWNPDVIELL